MTNPSSPIRTQPSPPVDPEGELNSLAPVPVALTHKERFQEYLQSRGMRNTEQRSILLEEVFAQHEHFDAEQLMERLPEKGSKRYVSRPTIYRTLGEFVDAGLLRKFDLDGRSVYEFDYGYPQHDHFYCTQCEKLIEFQSEELLKIRAAVADEHGFQVRSHRFIVSGICKSCRQSRRRVRRKVDLI